MLLVSALPAVKVVNPPRPSRVVFMKTNLKNIFTMETNLKDLMNSKGVVLVEFFATWCPHCQRMMPIVADVKKKLEGKAQVVQLDIDKNQSLADELGVEGVPTFILYKDDVEVDRTSGEMPEEALLEFVGQSL